MDDPKSKIRIVGIGASAGGLEALKEFFSHIPPDSGLAFVVIQHLDPNHASYTADLLSRQTRMRVIAAQDQSRIEANCVYTLPPNKFLTVSDGVLYLSDPFKNDGVRMPIDFFLRSLAQDQDGNAIAVLCSGGGSDGTLGIREVHGAGGLVMVQDPETAQFDSMLQSAIATGLVDFILPIEQIPRKLLDYIDHLPLTRGDNGDAVDDAIKSILNLLAAETKNDFRGYKKTTVRRRIERRMGLKQIYDFVDYYSLLHDNPAEVEQLAKDMLIGVTSFFRDPEAFEELLENVIAPLVQDHSDGNPLRIWIAGCATGEEAYSTVMLLMEEMARAKKSIGLQVFASDIDQEALKRAREGIYPESISADVPEERLARFFLKRDGSYQVDKQVRDCVTFAEHNIILDPPFLRMDLVSCRNLLIYIEPELQRKILNVLAFALKPGKYLFLGKSDTTAESSEVFETVSRSWRIFRRQQTVAVPFQSFPTRSGMREIRYRDPRPLKLGDLNQQVLLEHFNAAMVLMTDSGEILHFHGPTERYLTHPRGDASLKLYDMIDNSHSLVVRLAVERAARENQIVKLQLREFKRDSDGQTVELTIRPVNEPNSNKRLIAVIFEIAAKTGEAPAAHSEATNESDVVSQLEADNQRLKYDLQSAIESFQITHEEFTAANEEVLAVNEELQSANEELETSKEELQSVNEELITVNSQLNAKVEELSQANDDLANFLNTSEVGTLFVDRAHCIRRFTPSLTKILNLIALDVGRPLNHISNKLVNIDLVAIGDTVLKNLSSYEEEVTTTDGVWYMLRCIPYRTLENVIDGVVFTFTDVTRLKESQQAMLHARNFAEDTVNTVQTSLLVLSNELKVISANRAFYQTFKVSPEKTQGRPIYELGNGQWNIPRLMEILRDLLRTDTYVEKFEVKHEFPEIGSKVMSINARRITGSESQNVLSILLAIDDVTEQRQAEAEREWLEGELRQAQKMESVGTLAAGIAHDFNNILNIVQGYGFVLRDLGAKNELIAESVTAILDATQRGATIVHQLLTLARKTEPKFEMLKIDSLLNEMIHLFRQTFPKTIEIKLELSAYTLPVMADRNQMHQALLNLCLNARDAMPDSGTLTLKTTAWERNSLPNAAELKAEHYVCIEVRDTGIGMDEQLLTRIFEPFFTTKGTGRGTGLGLAVVYGVVRHHNGFIQVNSKPGEGTSFRIYLPALED
jgi:two-component system, chemotaxis family, CheB/CheR fusion protein